MEPYFNPYAPIDTGKHRLPHWQQGAVAVFVTWRLADSLPQEKLRHWQMEKQAWLQCHPLPWDDETKFAYHQAFSNRLDEWLDLGAGACFLKAPEIRKLLSEVLDHFDGKRYELESYVLMPNHVHVLFQPNVMFTLPDILQTWKGYSARTINRALGRSGSLWQDSYWDRLIRNQAHFDRCLQYIEANPLKANLLHNQFTLFRR